MDSRAVNYQGNVRLRQYSALSKRAVLRTIRQPAAVIPSLAFPMIFMAMSSAALDRSTSLPGFPPVDSFFQFLITSTIIQSALFGAVSAGADMARDIEDGFFERLVASPVARMSILVGRVMGAAALAFVGTWLFLVVGLIFGLDVESGIWGMLLIAVTASIVASGIGGLSMAMALRTGSSEAVQGSFPLLFSLLFLSSAFFPRTLMSGWFKTVATFNPFSHLIEGLRIQIIEGFHAVEALKALGVAAGLFAVGFTLASLALRSRLAVGS